MTGIIRGPIRVDGVTLQKSAAGVLSIKDGGVANAQVNAAAAIAKSKLANLSIVDADVNAAAAIAGTKLAVVLTTSTSKTASGTSSSGAAGTAICSITAAAGKRLVGMRVLCQNAGATSDQRITVTLSDDSTRTLDVTGTGANTEVYFIDEIGARRIDSGQVPNAYNWSAAVNLSVKSIAATTLAAGVAARYTEMSAIEVAA